MPDDHAALMRLMNRRDYVRCRTIGHSWDDIPVTEPHPDGPQFWLRCVSCHTVRKDVIDQRWGTLLHRSYDYPDDYRLASDEMPSRDDFRLRLLEMAETLAERRRKRKAS